MSNNIKSNLGLMHIYCGHGKGKTTASLGIILRAVGCNLKVVLTQFLKDGDSSELSVLKNFENVTIISGKEVKGFTNTMTQYDMQSVLKTNNDHLKKAIELCISGKCDLLVLDEIIGAINSNLVDYNILIEFLNNRPENIEVILTGRDPNKELLEIADYVSEIKKIKHPYDNGISARYGIEK